MAIREAMNTPCNFSFKQESISFQCFMRRHDRNVDEYRELMAVRVLVHRFARRMRVAVNELQEARNLIRQEVVNRGFIEPDYHFEQVVNLRRDGNSGQLNNNWDLAVFRKGSLRSIAISSLVEGFSFSSLVRMMNELPQELVFNVHKQFYVKGKLPELGTLWSQSEIFNKLLKCKDKRCIELHKMYEEVKKSVTIPIPSRLIREMKRKSASLTLMRGKEFSKLKQLYDFGLELGDFFLECLTYSWAGEAFQICRMLFSSLSLSSNMKKEEEEKLMYHMLVYYTGSCDFEKAKEVAFYFDSAFADAKKRDFRTNVDYGQVLIQCAVLWQQMGYYKKAMTYVVDALNTVARQRLPLLVRRFNENKVLSYVDAVEFLEDIFGNSSVCLSQAYEEMAYALYVLEYSTGNFSQASVYAEKAVYLNKMHLPSNHVLIATSRRMKVTALIMEEQALNEVDESKKSAMLEEALQLHTDALQYYQKRFGDENIFTAKNYGNIGRLYQSLREFKKSEEMHLKAIEIKKRVVGEEDYETALSLGHLAALYTNDMGRHREARDLFLKSAAIATKIFGETFTGLQYDYRGLHRVFTELGEEDLAQQYYVKLVEWYEKRRLKRAGTFLRIWSDIPYEEVKDASDLA
ncbi:unnamed protein product, partial [Enterobius vermicularis]|uniref:TPR_REGION domain-containing protein n=1 Tax=Enterobius vermicularis TaxID=51028 RepID=A0A0N4VHH6_ENTVE